MRQVRVALVVRGREVVEVDWRIGGGGGMVEEEEWRRRNGGGGGGGGEGGGGEGDAGRRTMR